MAERWNWRRLTRADVLVVGGICLLLIILAPVLALRPREQSIRRLCGTNLAQIGKTMLVYANDHQGALPRAGGPTTRWGPVAMCATPNHPMAFGLDADGNGGTATISSGFYLLAKYYETPARLFLCPGDNIYLISQDPQRGSPVGIIPFPGAATPANDQDSVLVHDPDVWGFGGLPARPCAAKRSQAAWQAGL